MTFDYVVTGISKDEAVKVASVDKDDMESVVSAVSTAIQNDEKMLASLGVTKESVASTMKAKEVKTTVASDSGETMTLDELLPDTEESCYLHKSEKECYIPEKVYGVPVLAAAIGGGVGGGVLLTVSAFVVYKRLRGVKKAKTIDMAVDYSG